MTSHFFDSSSLENLVHIELVFPIKQITELSIIHIQCSEFNLLLKQPFRIEKNWLKTNLTLYIHFFPVKFFIKFHKISLHSSAFLTLYFRRTTLSHKVNRGDTTSFYDDPSYCQFLCHKNSNMSSYFQMQNSLHHIHPKKISTLYCQSKRFAPTILLYYDGSDIILK
ncbi:unnamed protein product [Adineta steineri]|uniref:Uncharacterized protein n=1 Tax=Adineta steineri TaxID=433720 RepID=A0A815XVZ9_9BILA|nr:unnamed protein product [Adineta steineri]CAF1665403.1 unnamed protein product [Adineta steineri]